MRKHLDLIQEKLRDDLTKFYKNSNICYIFCINEEYIIKFQFNMICMGNWSFLSEKTSDSTLL